MRRLILTPRWILWHLLTLGAMVTCGLLSAWQWGRAGSAMGSAINVGYGLQWPIFAVFFGVMWWRMLRMEAARLTEESGTAPGADGPVAAAPGDAAGLVAGSPGVAVPGGTTGAWTAAAGAPGVAAGVAVGAGSPSGTEPARGGGTGASGSGGMSGTAAASPFGPRPADARPAGEEPDDHARAAYNRMLAELAARDARNA